MNTKDKAEFFAMVKDLIQQGYDRSPEFCAAEECTPEMLLVTLTQPSGEMTRQQTLIAFGGITWALEQLTKDQSIN